MKDYNKLFKHYEELFAQVDCFHFNSSLTSDIYNEKLNITRGAIIPISHSNIEDRRVIKTFDQKNVRLGFIGNITPYKGYNLLKECLNELSNDGLNNWELQVWGSQAVSSNDTNIFFRGKYNSNELKDVFSSIDILIVPSVWNETFSFITLEALSFGVPVLVSSTVGAKDIIKEYDETFIFTTRDDLKRKMEVLLQDITTLINFNQRVVEMPWKHSFQDHVNNIYDLYNTI